MTPQQANYCDQLSSGNIAVAQYGELVVNPRNTPIQGVAIYGGRKKAPKGLELSCISVAAMDITDFYLKLTK